MILELVSSQYLVVVSQLCLKFHCVLLFGHLASKNHLPGFEKPHTGLLPIFRCSKASNLIGWCGMCFDRCDIGNNSNRRFYSNIRTGQSTDAVRPLSKRTWIGMYGTRHKASKIGWGISGIPCLPGTLSSWNPRFRKLGTTHSVYWHPGFAEPRRADLLLRCAPPLSAIARWQGLYGPGTLVSLKIGFLGPCP